MYIQPNIYIHGNPGRPVISSVNCHISNISYYIDYHLKPIVQQIPSYTQDTSDFLWKINTMETIPDNSYLASLDVRSFYTNIPNSEGTEAVKTSLENFLRKTATKLITTFLLLILKFNNFVLICKNYFQIKDCTMGTICAPAYANIFMDHFEIKLVNSAPQNF